MSVWSLRPAYQPVPGPLETWDAFCLNVFGSVSIKINYKMEKVSLWLRLSLKLTQMENYNYTCERLHHTGQYNSLHMEKI